MPKSPPYKWKKIHDDGMSGIVYASYIRIIKHNNSLKYMLSIDLVKEFRAFLDKYRNK